ncbi:uncharacterized protein LOC108680933 [Hyalella azteca]|uniref:Uncharacterized protein LOC108680933 n=1 Tax=Hyalella azteca TaxID=294128 RepID=A0A8B7PH77_HYAAZ|nr:uncharacterized protein LOC108680933 [Hyalella azteca]
MSSLFNRSQPKFYENRREVDNAALHQLYGGWGKAVMHFDNLTSADHLRRLTCSAEPPDDDSVSTSVVLRVVGELQAPVVTEVSSAATAVELRCDAQDLEEHLQLCWYRGYQRLLCQEDSPVLSIGNVSLFITENLCNVELTCKYQLRKDYDALKDRVSDVLQKTFANAATSSYSVCRDLPEEDNLALAQPPDNVAVPSTPTMEAVILTSEALLKGPSSENLEEFSDVESSVFFDCYETPDEESEASAQSRDVGGY